MADPKNVDQKNGHVIQPIEIKSSTLKKYNRIETGETSDEQRIMFCRSILDQYAKLAMLGQPIGNIQLPSGMNIKAHQPTKLEIEQFRESLKQLVGKEVLTVPSLEKIMDMDQVITPREFMSSGMDWFNWYLDELAKQTDPNPMTQIFSLQECVTGIHQFYDPMKKFIERGLLDRTDLYPTIHLLLRFSCLYFIKRYFRRDPIVFFIQIQSILDKIVTLVEVVTQDDGNSADKEIMDNLFKDLMPRWSRQMLFVATRTASALLASSTPSVASLSSPSSVVPPSSPHTLMIPHIVRMFMYQNSEVSIAPLEEAVDEWVKKKRLSKRPDLLHLLLLHSLLKQVQDGGEEDEDEN